MTANQLLIGVIGLFFLSTGLMYIFHLKKKDESARREWTVSLALTFFGLLIMSYPFLSMISLGEDKGQNPVKSKLMGSEAFEEAPPIIENYEMASLIYARGAALWNMQINGYDSAEVAMKYFNTSIELFETAEALSARGQLKLQLSMMDEAIEDYDRAISIKPKYGNAYFNRAAVYYIFNDLEKACADWHKANELGISGAADLISSMCN